MYKILKSAYFYTIINKSVRHWNPAGSQEYQNASKVI